MAAQKKFSPFVSHSAVDGLSVLFALLMILFAEDVDTAVTELPAAFPLAIAVITGLFVLRVYRVRQTAAGSPGSGGTSPGKAALFLMIPGFNLVWVFIALRRIAVNVNDRLRARGIASIRINEGLSFAFSIIFVLTLVSLLDTRSVLFFCIFLLALLFVMRRLVWQWRQAEQRLTAGTDDVPPSTIAPEPGRTRTVFKAAGIAAASLAVSFFIVVWFASSVLVPFAGYKARGHLSSLKRDLTSASVAAQTYLAGHPKAVVVTEEQLKAGGWPGSAMNVFVSADMTARQGRIVLKNRYLARKKEYAPGTGVVDADGTVVLPHRAAQDKNDGAR